MMTPVELLNGFSKIDFRWFKSQCDYIVQLRGDAPARRLGQRIPKAVRGLRYWQEELWESIHHYECRHSD